MRWIFHRKKVNLKDMNTYITSFLHKRGLSTPEAVNGFLSFQPAQLRRVEDMVNGTALLSRLFDAVREKKEITIYGDYDADGVMASFILYSGLDRVNPGKIHGVINNRFEDGYGISAESMEKCLDKYPGTQVILTCDNGIGAAEAAQICLSRGVEMLVTDHHEQGILLPEGILSVDEKSRAQKTADAAAGLEPELFCGAELARRVMVGLYDLLGLTADESAYLDGLYAYAGFATITDSVPMNAANHYVARRGLEEIKKGAGVWGWLREELGIREISGDTIGFRYGPLVNAAARVGGSAAPAMRVFLLAYLGRETACRQAIRALSEYNDARKGMCIADDRRALALIEEQHLLGDPFLLVWDPAFSEGINGLTASHLCERFSVPAAVLSPVKGNPSLYKGSARSVEGFNLFEALTSYPDKIAAGGHPMAAGLVAKEADLPEIRALLCEMASPVIKALQEKKQTEGLLADYTFSPEQLSVSEVTAMQEAWETLEPFGPGFEAPRIALTGRAKDLFSMKNNVHAKFVLETPSADGCRVEALWWNHYEEARAKFEESRDLSFAGQLQINEFNGRKSIQFIIR